jgi:hypothetical protein
VAASGVLILNTEERVVLGTAATSCSLHLRARQGALPAHWLPPGWGDPLLLLHLHSLSVPMPPPNCSHTFFSITSGGQQAWTTSAQVPLVHFVLSPLPPGRRGQQDGTLMFRNRRIIKGESTVAK